MFKTTKVKIFFSIFLIASLATFFCAASSECCREYKIRERQEFVAACKVLFWSATAVASFCAIADSVAHPHNKETQLLLGTIGFFISLIGLSSSPDDGSSNHGHYYHHDTTHTDCSCSACNDHGYYDYSYDYDYDDHHSCHGSCCGDHNDHYVVDHHHHHPSTCCHHEPVVQQQQAVSNTYVDQSTNVHETTHVTESEPKPDAHIEPDSPLGQFGSMVYNVMTGATS